MTDAELIEFWRGTAQTMGWVAVGEMIGIVLLVGMCRKLDRLLKEITRDDEPPGREGAG